MTIPILRPRLPPLAALAPYLERIDRACIYTNFGPLSLELEERLASRLKLPEGGVCSAANGTLALSAALQAQSPPAESLCLMPAWTFIASPLAAISAGLVPYFVDVEPDDWLLHPETLTGHLQRLKGRVGAVMPVAAFGQPVDTAAWDRFRDATGLAVVIDAAAGFDAVTGGAVPNVVSLHATKILGAGEGGFVASTDTALVRRIRSRLAFGFDGTREATVAGTNGKLSEYHAAVGLAALDTWPEARAAWLARARSYAAALGGGAAEVRLQPGFGAQWISATLVVEFTGGTAAADAARRLAKAGIASRAWWEAGAHRHPATAALPRGGLAVTERLAQATLGLPFHLDLSAAQIGEVAEKLASGE